MNQRNLNERVSVLETVLNALLKLLHKRKIVTQDEMQLEIMDNAEEVEHGND